jgi:hypothetical protein
LRGGHRAGHDQVTPGGVVSRHPWAAAQAANQGEGQEALMSLEAWIIDELERERHEEEAEGDRPELTIQQPQHSDVSRPKQGDDVRRGVRILDISPAQENVIDL